ncbi:MAG: hypothetical protein EBY22_06800 [Gammaproteobacteria bacterium]|nr:hypothetical protein [Gammaproteobacteria bacterium]
MWDKMLEEGATVASIKEGLLFYRRHRENFLKYSHESLRLQDLHLSYALEERICKLISIIAEPQSVSPRNTKI